MASAISHVYRIEREWHVYIHVRFFYSFFYFPIFITSDDLFTMNAQHTHPASSKEKYGISTNRPIILGAFWK